MDWTDDEPEAHQMLAEYMSDPTVAKWVYYRVATGRPVSDFVFQMSQ